MSSNVISQLKTRRRALVKRWSNGNSYIMQYQKRKLRKCPLKRMSFNEASKLVCCFVFGIVALFEGASWSNLPTSIRMF